jgi:hypothetical protein
LAEAWSGAKFAEVRVIPVVVKIAAPGLTEIPVSDQVSFLSSRFTARSDRRSRLFQKIDAGASGLIVTITADKKISPGLPILCPKPQPSPPCHVMFARPICPLERPVFAEVQSVPGHLGGSRNVKSMTGQLGKRKVN